MNNEKNNEMKNEELENEKLEVALEEEKTQSASQVPDTADDAAADAEPTAAVTQVSQKSRRSTISIIVMIAAILVFIGAMSFIIKEYVDIKKSQNEAEKIASMVETTDDAVGEDGIFEKYREAYNTNNELVGWIKIPNTTIDHPVVQSDDNSKYLRRNFYGDYDKRGTVFMDYKDHVDELCKNTILYGHNYLDSTMFSDLEKYKDIEFYRENPVIEFNTIYKNYKWKVVSVFLTNASDYEDNGYTFNYIYPFMTEDNFEEYIDEILVRSLYFTTTDINKTDKILTLSTCTRDMDIKGQGESNARCVVIARLVRDGESEEVDTASAIVNSNPRYPQIWYTAHGLTNPFVNANRWYPEGVEY